MGIGVGVGMGGPEQLDVLFDPTGGHCATSVDRRRGRAWVESAAGSVPQQA